MLQFVIELTLSVALLQFKVIGKGYMTKRKYRRYEPVMKPTHLVVKYYITLL